MKLESIDLELMIAAAANRVQEHTAVNYKKKCSVDGDDWLCSVCVVYEE